MLASLIILGCSAALFCYWFRYTCLLVLSTETALDTSERVAAQYGLQFSRLQRELEEAGSVALEAVMKSLERDFAVVESLVRRQGEAREQEGMELTLLSANFRVLRVWFRLVRSVSETRARRSLLEMAQIVRHFANELSEVQMAATGSRG
jgi:hypothetical protein